MTNAIVIRLVIKKSPSGLYMATSEDLPRFLMADRDLGFIKANAPAAIKEMLEIIYKAPVQMIDGQLGQEAEPDDTPVWVAIPAHVAQAALAHQ